MTDSQRQAQEQVISGNERIELTQEQVREITERAKARDLVILETYRGQEVVLKVNGEKNALGGTISEIGENLFEMRKCMRYQESFDTIITASTDKLEKLFCNQGGSRRTLPNLAISKRYIEQYVLLEDLKNRANREEQPQ